MVVIESKAGGATFEYPYENYLKPEIVSENSQLRESLDELRIGSTDHEMLRLILLGASVYPYLVPDLLKHANGNDMTEPTNVERYGKLVSDTQLDGILAGRKNKS